jgi:REP element-mobilizing transposase RayT
VKQNPTIGDIVGAFKSITTVNYIRGIKSQKWDVKELKLWQRNYYEHIIRNEFSYQQIAEYIATNPAKWQDDKYFKP